MAGLPFSLRVVFGGSLLALGGAIAARARATFVAAGTNVNPMQPALAMVTAGIFSHVRNPMYEGGTLLLIGLALILGSDWMLILSCPRCSFCTSAWCFARSAISVLVWPKPIKTTDATCPATGGNSSLGGLTENDAMHSADAASHEDATVED